MAIKIIHESDAALDQIYEEHIILSEIIGEGGGSTSFFPGYLGTYRNTASVPHQIWFVMEVKMITLSLS